jgi:hypothetical protein
MMEEATSGPRKLRRVTVEVAMSDEELSRIVPSSDVHIAISAKGNRHFDGMGEIVRVIDKPIVGL